METSNRSLKIAEQELQKIYADIYIKDNDECRTKLNKVGFLLCGAEGILFDSSFDSTLPPQVSSLRNKYKTIKELYDKINKELLLFEQNTNENDSKQNNQK